MHVWLLLSLAGLTPCQAQIGFQVSPAKIYINHSSTTEQTARLHLTNTMDKRLILQATCADWRRDSAGTKVYYPAGTLPTSCCSVVRVTPTVIELAPHEERDILVTVLADASSGAGLLRNAMVLLTQVNEQETASASRSSQFIIRVQIGVHVYVLPAESVQPDVAITGMKLSRSGDRYQVKVQVANQGGTLLESQLRVEYLNLATMQEVKMEPMPVNTMPKEQFNVTALVPDTLPKGKYLIVAILDSGSGQPLKVAELETELK
ncbi:hypothetical protein ACAW75_22710 [Fibrella sp. Tmos10]